MSTALDTAAIASPTVAIVALIVTVRFTRAQSAYDRLEAHRIANEDRRQAHKARAVEHDVDVALRISVAFERHQAGDELAGAECRGLLRSVRTWLPVLRSMYLGSDGLTAEDHDRIRAHSEAAGLPVGVDLARQELDLHLEGEQFALYSGDGGEALWPSTTAGLRLSAWIGRIRRNG